MKIISSQEKTQMRGGKMFIYIVNSESTDVDNNGFEKSMDNNVYQLR